MFDEKEVDLIGMEAARYILTQKVNNDHLKLLAKNSTTFNHETVEISMVQMCSDFFIKVTPRQK
jgi:hypothetical protein